MAGYKHWVGVVCLSRGCPIMHRWAATLHCFISAFPARVVVFVTFEHPYTMLDNISVWIKCLKHYDDVIMTMLASQITSLPVVCSIVYSDVNQRKHQSSASLAFVREIHRGPVNFPHKWPVTRKMFPFDDVIMIITEYKCLLALWILLIKHNLVCTLRRT